MGVFLVGWNPRVHLVMPGINGLVRFKKRNYIAFIYA